MNNYLEIWIIIIIVFITLSVMLIGNSRDIDELKQIVCVDKQIEQCEEK